MCSIHAACKQLHTNFSSYACMVSQSLNPVIGYIVERFYNFQQEMCYNHLIGSNCPGIDANCQGSSKCCLSEVTAAFYQIAISDTDVIACLVA